MILPGETEAGTAGTQPCRGILRWAHRDDGQGREDRPCAAQPPSDRKTPCLKNPRPEGAESTLTENAVSPFHAEPTQKLYATILPDLPVRDRCNRAGFPEDV